MKPESDLASRQAKSSYTFLKSNIQAKQNLTHHEYLSSISTEKINSALQVVDYLEQIHKEISTHPSQRRNKVVVLKNKSSKEYEPRSMKMYQSPDAFHRT